MGKRILCLAALTALLFGLALGNSAHAGLVSYWDFDGDAVATVGTDGNMINGPTATTDRNGVAGQALAFDGTLSQYVEVADGGGLNGAYVGTISMWVKWSGTQDSDTPAWNYYGAVMGRQSSTGFSNNLIALGDADPAAGGVRWGPAGAAASTIDGATVVGDGVWHHVAVAFQPHFTGLSELFLDGASQGTVSAEALSQSVGAEVALSLGAWIGGGGSYSTTTMDDVAIFDDMLSASQINALYTQTETPLSVGEGTDVEVPLRGVVATASSEFGSRYADQTADGVGRNTTNPDSYEFKGHPIGMWLSNGTFASPNDLDPEITYDLGEVTELSKMVVYNYNEVNSGSRGVKVADIYSSTNGTDWALFDTVEFDLAPGDDTNPGQEVNLGGLSAQYVKFDVDMNYQQSDYSFAGLSEVDFYVGSGVQIPGDADGDGYVDEDDAAILAQNWGTTTGATWGMGDFTGEGAVNAADAAVMAANWNPPVAESASVPEPSILVMIGSLLAFALWRKRVL